jgi:phytoene synthase
MLRGGSRSFFAASLVLPRRVHEPATALYAFCRIADDAIDCDGGGAAALDPLRDRLARAYAGRPLPFPADRALARVVARHAIPRTLPEALLDGFEWDAQGRRYEDIADLCDYAARVAGTVGAMMAVLMGARAPDVIARACDLGVAMQLTNIARDVGEDARAGRLYLPLRWLRDAGIDADAWLARPAFTPALGSVVQRLLGVAETLYLRADAGIALLPLACRPGIGAARRLYAEIGREVARRGYDSVASRASVPTTRKLGLLARSVAAAAVPAARGEIPTLDAVRFLVDAVATAPQPPVRAAPWQGLDERAAWLFDLFDRLEQRQQAGS